MKSKTTTPKVSQRTKSLARESNMIGALCWQKAMGMIPLEVRELIKTAVMLGEMNAVCNPEEPLRLYTNYEYIQKNAHYAERLLTGVDKDFFQLWTQEAQKLKSRKVG